MSYVKIWIHAIWATRNREKALSRNIRSRVFEHIHQNALSKGIFMDCVGGHLDHVHCLFRIRNDQMLHEILQRLKGESSHWINKDCNYPGHFAWQKEYLAISVSESQVGRVRKYIQNQEEHHRRKTFGDEFAQLIMKHAIRIKG